MADKCDVESDDVCRGVANDLSVHDASVADAEDMVVEHTLISREELEDPTLAYPILGQMRGVCIIVNEENFDKQRTGQDRRTGSSIDTDNCRETFTNLGYNVCVFRDLNMQQLIDLVKEYAGMNHTEFDSFIFILMTHGEGEYVYTYDGKVKIGDMLNNFKANRCPSLFGKPKLFFFQACRGRQMDRGMRTFTDYCYESSIIKKIPVEADFMIAYACCPGYTAWRNTADGSWFIKSLCKVLREHSRSAELMHLMILVNRLVAYDYQSATMQEVDNEMKQMPSFVTMLTKLFYFHNRN